MKRLVRKFLGLCPECGGSAYTDAQPCDRCNPGVTDQVSITRIKAALDAIDQNPYSKSVKVFAYPNQYERYCEWFGKENVQLVGLMPS